MLPVHSAPLVATTSFVSNTILSRTRMMTPRYAQQYPPHALRLDMPHHHHHPRTTANIIHHHTTRNVSTTNPYQHTNGMSETFHRPMPGAETTMEWNGQVLKKLPTTYPNATPTPGHRDVPSHTQPFSPEFHAHHNPRLHANAQYPHPTTQPLTTTPSETNFLLQDHINPHIHTAADTMRPNYSTRSTLTKGEQPQRDFIQNPFETFWQRLKFRFFTPTSVEHRNLEPKLFQVELKLSRAFNRARRWVYTRNKAHLLKLLFKAGCAYALWRVGRYYWSLPKLVEIPNYEYHPELPTKHIPYRGALLPHTLPPHLSGVDSLFIKDFVPDYPQENEIDRGQYMRQRDPPKMGLGRTPSRAYLQSLDGFGERFDGRQLPFVQRPEMRSQQLLEDVPPQIEEFRVKPDSPYRPKFQPPEDIT